MITRRQFLDRSGLLLAWCGIESKYPAFAFHTTANRWTSELEHSPLSAHPWVYAFWMEGNITKEGITADLEGMKRAGISGMEFMCVDLGNPKGPHRFMSESWYELFNHLLIESDRLGIQIDMNDAPGWDGSGGAWITHEMASQQIVATELVLLKISDLSQSFSLLAYKRLAVKRQDRFRFRRCGEPGGRHT